MKKQVQLLCMMALIAIVGLTSCTKKPEKPEDLIVGKWKITEFQMCDSNGDNILPDAFGETWSFEEDGSFNGWCLLWQHQSNPYLYSNYTIDGEELTIRGGDFVFSDEEIMFTLDINSITEKELSVSGKWRYGKWKDDYHEWMESGTISASLKK